MSDNDHTSRPSKRRRVALACSNCRTRKTRCDGSRPKCGLCIELCCDCVYDQSGATASLTVGRSYLERLEQRLADIESTLHKVTNSPRRHYGEDETGKDVRNHGQGGQGGNEAAEKVPDQLDPGPLDELETAEDSIDGMGAIKFTDEQDWGYFGASSNIAFLHHISLAMPRDGSGRTMHPPNNDMAGGMSVSRPHHAESDIARRRRQDGPRQNINIYGLPSEERTRVLIAEYFQKTGQLLPFVHEKSFWATYSEMKRTNFTKARRTWLGLLNIIMAMATTLHVEADVSAEERIEESDVYYQRAHGLCDKESAGNISLELVQYHLILGQYLQGTQKSVQAWTVHGLAITTAFQLGLHSPKSNKRFSPLESEIRKRVWGGCILLDRSLSMTFGRPSMIHESYLKLDLPSATLQMVGRTTPEPMATSPPQMDALFYTATLTLYKIMYKIIDTCYDQNLGVHDPTSTTTNDSKLALLVLKGEEQLAEWLYSLPSIQMTVYQDPTDFGPPQVEAMVPENKIVERFFIVLSVRYHNLQILLHRPILEKFLDACGNSAASTSAEGEVSTTIHGGRERGRGLANDLGISSIEKCVSSSMAIISIVRTVVLSRGWRRDLLGAWNYSLFYTFNAGLVIFGAMHVARNDCQADPGRISRWKTVEAALPYFNMAIEALQSLDRGNRVVERCVSYLSQLTVLPIMPEHSGRYGNDSLHYDTARVQTPASSHMALSATKIAPGAVPRQEDPFEIDLNEFILDTDLDLFSRNLQMP